MSDQVNLLPTLTERFWSHVDRSGGPDACWPWLGARRPGKNENYGRFAETRTRVRPTHRVAWELTNGPIPEGMEMRHVVCDNPPCVNPAHLEPGTHVDNIADMDRKGRRVAAIGDRNGARLHPESHRGERNGSARLTEADVRLILSTPREYGSSVRLSRELGVSVDTVRHVRYGVSWRHVA